MFAYSNPERLASSSERLAWRPGHITTTQQVKMDMPDHLPAGRVAIDNDPETVFSKTEVMGDLAGDLMNMTDQFIICSCQIKNGADMLARNDQEMMRRLRVDVLDDDQTIILENLLAGDLAGNDFTEYTIF